MRTFVFEATQNQEHGPNWGKFLVGVPDEEYRVRSAIDPARRPLLRQIGWNGSQQVLVVDLQTKEGAVFLPDPAGSASADLGQHAIHVCPLYEHFLKWLYRQDMSRLGALPQLVELPEAPFELYGHRRRPPAPAPVAAATALRIAFL